MSGSAVHKSDAGVCRRECEDELQACYNRKGKDGRLVEKALGSVKRARKIGDYDLAGRTKVRAIF